MRNTFAILMVWVLGCCLGCKKQQKSNPYSFGYSDSMYVGDVVSFSPNFVAYNNLGIIPAGSSFVWDFGDNSTSSDPKPTHIYSQSGDFVATMIVDDDAGNAVHNTVHILPYTGSIYTSHIGGNRLWSGTDSRNWGPTYPVIDTSLAVEIIDSGKVTFMNATLHCTGIDTTLKLLHFSQKLLPSSQSTGSIFLNYYYNNDSLTYDVSVISNIGHGGEMLHIHTL